MNEGQVRNGKLNRLASSAHEQQQFLTSIAPYIRPYICLSVTRRYCIETAEGIEHVFGIKATLGLFYSVLKVSSDISKSKSTSHWKISYIIKFGLRKKYHTGPHVDRRVVTSRLTTVTSLSKLTLSVDLCLQHYGCDAARRGFVRGI